MLCIDLGVFIVSGLWLLFLGATLLLFVAMIGAIVLTLGKIEKKGHLVRPTNVLNWKYSK